MRGLLQNGVGSRKDYEGHVAKVGRAEGVLALVGGPRGQNALHAHDPRDDLAALQYGFQHARRVHVESATSDFQEFDGGGKSPGESVSQSKRPT